jgi:hypothetical protein
LVSDYFGCRGGRADRARRVRWKRRHSSLPFRTRTVPDKPSGTGMDDSPLRCVFSLAMAGSSFCLYWVSLLRHDAETGLLIFFATVAELIIVLIFLAVVLVLNEFIGRKV